MIFFEKVRTIYRLHTYRKLPGKYNSQKMKKHFEGLITENRKAKARKAPLMIPEQSPKVHQRPLEVYDSLICEVG